MSVWEEVRWKCIGAAGRLLLGLWAKTARLKVLGEEEYQKIRSEGKPVIHLIWHGRLMLAPYFFRKRRVAALVSPSKDGEVVARIGLGWGFRIIRGSSSHSIVRAWVEMKDELERGGELLIIPDGPRGPDRVLKAGCLKLAQETGAALIPWSFSASRKKFLRSWDRLLLFYPFSRLAVVYGKPLTLKAGATAEELEEERCRIEQALTDLDAEADRYFN
ncbi:MAG: lysophospholipid acyltransferase family protein [Acidobacteriota bacterium]